MQGLGTRVMSGEGNHEALGFRSSSQTDRLIATFGCSVWQRTPLQMRQCEVQLGSALVAAALLELNTLLIVGLADLMSWGP